MAFEGLAAAGLDAATPSVTIDFSAVDSMSLSVDEHHAVNRRLRVLFTKGPEFRVALVAATPQIRSELAHAVEVRDLMIGRAVEELPEVRFVDSLDDARDWLSPEGE